jgi:hypothetical protein
MLKNADRSDCPASSALSICLRCLLSPKGEFMSDDYPIFWRVAANILNKQSLTAVKGWSSGCGIGGEVNNYL